MSLTPASKPENEEKASNEQNCYPRGRGRGNVADGDHHGRHEIAPEAEKQHDHRGSYQGIAVASSQLKRIHL